MSGEEFGTLLTLLGWEHYEHEERPHEFIRHWDVYILRGVGFVARVKIQSNGQSIVWFDYGDKDFRGPTAKAAEFFKSRWQEFIDNGERGSN